MELCNKNIYDAKTIIELLKSNELVDLYKVEKINTVIVFGSITTDEFMEYSDVDIAILSNEKITLSEVMNLEETLSKKLLRDIDIINLNQEDMDLNFKVSVLDQGKLIHNDAFDLYTSLYNETEAIYKNNETFRFFRERDVIFDE